MHPRAGLWGSAFSLCKRPNSPAQGEAATAICQAGGPASGASQQFCCAVEAGLLRPSDPLSSEYICTWHVVSLPQLITKSSITRR